MICKKIIKILFLFLFYCSRISVFGQDVSVWEALNYDKNKVIVAAHRGDWKNFPENSLEGIQSCIDRGIDIVEIDVQKTKDGHYILMHDQTVRRTTNGKKSVSKYNLSEITKLRLRDRNGRLTDYHVPTLDEALKLAKGKIILNLDKSAGRFNDLLQIIEKYHCGENIILKGDGPADYFKKISSNDETGTLFMPIINGRRSNTDTFVFESKASLIEVLLRNDSDAFCQPDNLERIKALNCKIWYNALFNSISGGHTESQSAIESWDWFINHDAKVIQTDYPFELLQYLINKNLHEIPDGFVSVDLNRLPKKKIYEMDSTVHEKEVITVNKILATPEDSTDVEEEEELIVKPKKVENKESKTKKEGKSNKKYHTVKEGESLRKIASRYGTTVKRLLKLNPKLKKHGSLKRGSKVKIR